MNKEDFNPWYYIVDNLLVKKKKPCSPGSQVHISLWEGCYTVYEVKLRYFTVMKKRVEVQVPWSAFICLKGEGVSKEAQIKRIVNELDEKLFCTLQSLSEIKELLKK